MRTRRAAAFAASLGLIGGGAAFTMGPAFADSPATIDDTVPDDDATATTDAAADDESAAEPADEIGTEEAGTESSTDDGSASATAESWIDDVLADLVADGTLDQSQADAVATAIEEALPAFGPGRSGGRIGVVAVSLATVAETLGVTSDDLTAAFAEGQSIADVATAQGVDVQTVIDALVATASERIDELVTAGDLTEEEGAERLATATERITELVNQAGGLPAPDRPHGPGNHDGGGFPGGPGGFPDAPGGGDFPGGPAPDVPAASDDTTGSADAPADSAETATTDTVADA